MRRRDLYLDYWAKLIDRLESTDSVVTPPKLKGNPRLRMPSGVKSYWLLVKAEPKTRRIAAGFRTTGASRHAKLDALRAALPDLEEEFGLQVEWNSPRAYIYRPESNLLDPEEWGTHLDWLVTTLERLQELLGPAIKSVIVATPSDDEDDEDTPETDEDDFELED